MSHVRTQIRNAAVAALTSLTGVHAARVYPVPADDLPVYLVYVSNEEADIQGAYANFATLQRTLRLMVQIVVTGDDLDAALNAGMAAVEPLMGADITLGGTCAQCLLAGVEIASSVEGSAPIGRATLTYEAVYRTSIDDPEHSI